MEFIHDLNQRMAKHEVVLVYRGDFTQETTKSILAMAERNLEVSGEESNIKKKIFNVMVEALQNIVKHSDEGKERAGEVSPHSAIFLIGHEHGKYSIMSGNPVKNENVANLQAALERVNSLDKDGLRELYKEIIKSTTISEKGGAGLGFVDMARKSGEKLQWTFIPLDEQYSFFCLRVNIAKQMVSVL